MNCKYCGAPIGDFDNNCSQCGAPVVRENAQPEATVEQPAYPQNDYQQPVNNYQPANDYQQPVDNYQPANDFQQPAYAQNGYPQNGYQQPYQPAAAPADPGKGLGIASMVLGIVGFVSCCCLSATGLGAIIGPVCLIVGLILGIVAKSKSKAVGSKNSPAIAGIVLSLIPIVLGVIGVIVVLLFGSTILAALAGMLEEMGMGDLTYMLEEILGEFGMYY